ncbi:immunoglobulin kappa light chain-like isoform X1 [Scyliorhinus canicula]|uniref:immunoglobulin kappa light chain-like isoform X1 n=1 Tax=Scyliorhinus canicula TaxID=7830 RepID=UPI0018F5C32B|nr:immunoglobulin kappa light chain-like isoform X1 [Scyliorhinus canicula]
MERQGMFCTLLLIFLQMDPALTHTELHTPSTTVLGQEGESLTLECRSSRDSLLVKWGYVPPGSTAIRWLLSWSQGSKHFTRMPGIEPRFSGSNESKHILNIDNLKQKDSATYYCQNEDTADDWCGCGITLKVKPTILPRPPSVDVHYAPPESISQQTGNSTLVCVSRGFYPKEISVSWYKGGIQVFSEITHWGRLMDSNDCYTMISKLAISTSQWFSGSHYTCVVSHEALSSPIIRKINKDDGYIQEPVIQLVSPPLDAASAGLTVVMSCLVSDFYPADISVTWRDENGPVDTGVMQFAVALGSNSTYRTVSQLTVPTAERESNCTYWCEVKHVSLGQPIRRAVSKELASVKPSHSPGMVALLWIVAIVGCLLLITVAVIVYKKTTSSFRTETGSVGEPLSYS